MLLIDFSPDEYWLVRAALVQWALALEGELKFLKLADDRVALASEVVAARELAERLKRMGPMPAGVPERQSNPQSQPRYCGARADAKYAAKAKSRSTDMTGDFRGTRSTDVPAARNLTENV